VSLLRVLVSSSVCGESEALGSDDDDAADDAHVLLVYARMPGLLDKEIEKKLAICGSGSCYSRGWYP
jgi:hypothetical protein